MAKRKYEEDDSEFLYHTHCDDCGSSDANSVFSDGHTFCYACDAWHPPTDDKRR